MDYGQELLFGTFVTPLAQPPQQAVELAILADRLGLDVVTFQDHPYQVSFLDTWTLLSYVAARTERIHVSGNVLNLPLRNPALLARSAASLDRLSGGRVELGIGAGGFWDAIASMGGPRRSPGESIDALEEAITLIRDLWNVERRGGVNFDGTYYHLHGARRGPAPLHSIGIWVGAYKPRISRLVGRLADGALPSLPYLQGGPADLAEINKNIDEGAAQANRAPGEIRRLLNIGGRFQERNGGLLEGPPEQWAEQLAELTVEYAVTGFLLSGDDPNATEVFASEVAPRTRELVATARGR